MEQEIIAAMAVRDLMGSIAILSELTDDYLATEREDIELAYRRLIKLLMRTEQKEIA